MEQLLREAELREQLHALDAALNTLRVRSETFRKRNMAVIGSGHVVFISSNLNSRETLETEWLSITNEASKLTVERSKILSELSELTHNPGETQHVAGELKGVTHV